MIGRYKRVAMHCARAVLCLVTDSCLRMSFYVYNGSRGI